LHPIFLALGFSEVPEKRRYKYSFAALTQSMLAFTDAMQLKRYAM
jgi:hypothetical protein